MNKGRRFKQRHRLKSSQLANALAQVASLQSDLAAERRTSRDLRNALASKEELEHDNANLRQTVALTRVKLEKLQRKNAEAVKELAEVQRERDKLARRLRDQRVPARNGQGAAILPPIESLQVGGPG